MFTLYISWTREYLGWRWANQFMCTVQIIVYYIHIIYTKCTWILKSNYPCTLKITLQKHWIYAIAFRVSMYFLSFIYLSVVQCVIFSYEHENITAIAFKSQSDIGVSCSMQTQYLALLSSLKLSMFNRYLAKEANELTEIKPQPFDWIFLLWGLFFFLFVGLECYFQSAFLPFTLLFAVDCWNQTS